MTRKLIPYAGQDDRTGGNGSMAKTRQYNIGLEAAGLGHFASLRCRRLSNEEIRRRIPDDTRDLTARLLGDPLPGRSALDRGRR